MSIEIPRGINLDKLIVPRFNLKVNQKKVALLESNKRLVYPVEFGIGDDIDSLEEGDRIPSFHFKIKEDNNSSVTFTIINARMFDWSILINRGEFISQDAINKINRHLRKGKLSRCEVYDALLLWEQSQLLWSTFVSEDTDNDYRWIGVKPFTTKLMRCAIFQIRKDESGKPCLLMGDHTEQTSFSSRCPIVLRYERVH